MGTPIATKADVKLYASITSSNQDALIDSLIPACMTAIGTFCNRLFDSRTTVEYRNGNDASRMQLANYPIVSVSSLKINGISIPASINGSPGYIARAGGRTIALIGYTFFYGASNIEISLIAGYGDASLVNPWPTDLKLALLAFVVARLREREHIGMGSKTLAGESVSFADASSGPGADSLGIPNALRHILMRYANTVPETGL